MKIEEEKLFEVWKKTRKDFIPDGLVKEDEYKGALIKVLYILKEVNGGRGWDLRKHLRENHSRVQTWKNIARWQYGIEHYLEKNIWEKVKQIDDEFRHDQLKKIAVVNLKKESGKATANNADIRKYAWDDRELLKQQISIYQPNIIICCGTGEIVKEFKLVGSEFFETWKNSSAKLEYHITKNGVVILNHCHPQKRSKDKDKFIPLIETLIELNLNI